MKNLQYILKWYFSLILAGTLFACNDEYDAGELITPEITAVIAEAAGTNAENPNGDGTGVITFRIEAENAFNYKIFRPDGSSINAPDGRATMIVSDLGTNTYEFTVVAYGTGGLSDSATIAVDVLVTYTPPADLLQKLVGDGERVWRIKAEKQGHFGLGPVGGSTPVEWYGAAPFEKEGTGMYDDRYVFNIDGTFTHITDINTADNSGTVFGRVGLIDEIGSGGEVTGADVLNMPLNDYSANWQLIAPNDVETLVLSGTAFIGYYTGGNHQYQIFDRSVPNELLLRTTDGNGEFDWWFVLTTDEGGETASCEDGYTGNEAGTGEYVVVWEDHFDENGAPCDANWSYNTGAGGWGNNESQYYTDRPDNVVVEDGLLKITAKREFYQGSDFTSARLVTKDKMEFTYGKVEVRARLPHAGGSWPAIWMLGANFDEVGWPATGEIDIMEHVGNNPNHVINAIHVPAGHGGTAFSTSTPVSNTNEFHVYSVEWDENEIKFFTDDNLTFTYAPSPKNAENWPFTAEQFIILNVAVGGTLGGVIPESFNSATMEVDYVKVYQK